MEKNEKIKMIKICIAGSFGYKDIGDEAMLTEDLAFILDILKIPRENIYLIGGQPDYLSYYHNHPIDNCLKDSFFVEKIEAEQSQIQQLRQQLLQARQQLQAEFNELKRKRGILGKIKLLFVEPKTTITQEPELSPPSEPEPIESRIAKSSDMLLVTGGGTINTRDPNGRSVKRMHAIVTFFKKLGKPIFMSGQTIGPLGLIAEHDKLALEIINSVDFLTVRDNSYSRRYLEVINAKPKNFVETFDDAYTLPYKDEVLPDNIIEFTKSGNVVAFNVSEYTSDLPEQRVFIAKLCECLISEFSLKVLLVSHTTKDYFNLLIIYDMINNNLKKSILLPDIRMWRDKTLKKMISSCKIAIGGRYHFIVFAGTSNTPFIGMCGNHYSYIKQDGFAKQLGMSDFILTEKETWDMDAIKAKIKSAMNLKIDFEHKFERPSVSMKCFGEWLQKQTLK